MSEKRTLRLSFAYKLVIVLLVGLIAGVGELGLLRNRKTPASHYTGSTESVSTGLIGEYASLILIAQDRGYFKANGLNVTIKDYPSGPAALADLLSGKVDTAMASDFAGVRNSFKGEDLKILANMSKSEAFYVVARKDRAINVVNDLSGKKIGLTRKTVGEFYLGQFLTFNKLGLGDVNVVDLPQSELIEAVVGGQVDAAVLFEPNAYKANLRLGANAIRWSVQGNQSIYSLLYTTDELVREQPHIVEKYLRAVVEAEQFIKVHDSQARDIVAKRLGYNADYINYIWPKFQFSATLDQELLINMDDEARWTIENQLAPGPTIPNYFRLLYFKGLEAVKPDGITVIR